MRAAGVTEPLCGREGTTLHRENVTEPLCEAENEMILFHGTTPSYVFSFPDPPSPEMTQPRCVKYPPPNNTDNI